MDLNKEIELQRQRARMFHKKNPFVRIFNSIRQRCENPKIKLYKHYGAKGIKNLITKAELKQLWERDEADSMRRPSIDRIDSKGNYELKNCRFIELSENCRRARIKNKI